MNFRFIGGTKHGSVVNVPTNAHNVRIPVPSFPSFRSETYVKRVIRIRRDAFALAETVFVLEGTKEIDAQRQLVALGFPKMDWPNMVPLTIRPSTAIRGLAYCERTQTLDVTLSSGGTYRYATVPKDVVFSLVTADSQGSFYSRNIRERFPCTRLD